MKKAVARIAALTMMIVLLCAAAQADGGAWQYSQTDPGLSGTVAAETWLYVTVPYGTAQITLMQDGLAPLEMTNAWGSRKNSMHFANYTVTCSNAGYYGAATEYAFDGLTCILSLQQGSYLLRVKAGEISAITEKSVFGAWQGKQWSGQAPGWRVADYSGCTLSPYGSGSTPYQASASVTVLHQALDGTLLYSEQKTLQNGAHTLTARYDLPNYTPYGQTSRQVTVTGGVASENVVTFWYQPQYTQTGATIVVYYKTTDGQTLAAENRALTNGLNQIACTRTFSGYTLADYSTKTVAVFNGKSNVQEVTFYFSAVQTAKTVAIKVIYQAEDGTWNVEGTTEELTPGTYTVYPEFTTYQSAWGEYQILDPQQYTVVVMSNGNTSAQSLTFRFTKVSTGKTVVATGKVFVRKGPGIDYPDITDMRKGDTAIYLDEGKASNNMTWYKIRYTKNNKEYTGWVSSVYAEVR